MTRTPPEVLAHHSQAFGAADLDEIVAEDGMTRAQTVSYTLQRKG